MTNRDIIDVMRDALFGLKQATARFDATLQYARDNTYPVDLDAQATPVDEARIELTLLAVMSVTQAFNDVDIPS